MSDRKPKILLAEDDTNLGVLLLDCLEREGFVVKLCKDGLSALTTFSSTDFDLCLLDIMMPELDGFSVASRIRLENKKVPIIFITAKSLKSDKLKGYLLGADDYVTKPFDEEELIWKIKAMIRRIPEDAVRSESVTLGKYKFDYHNQALTLNQTTKRITEKEAEILKYLYDHRNKVVRREEMLKALWGENDYFLGRSLDVFIAKIRKYLSDDPGLTIETVFGVGFILNIPAK